MNAPFQYVLRLGDNSLILAQRLGEWCGHGPVLEQDIALANIALDQLGQARMLLTHAGTLEGLGRGEDELAFFRDAHQYTNVLLVEHPNEDWAFTIARQFFFDAFNLPLYQALCHSADEQLSAIAHKAVKEITYHLRFSSEWMVRLGDGTDLSRAKMQTAVDDLWRYTGELTTPDDTDLAAAQSGLGPNLTDIHHAWNQTVNAVLEEATLTRPADTWMQSGGKQGRHTEKLGFMLAEMQHVQRTYPGQVW